MRFIRIFFNKFFCPGFLPDRLWRSTGPQSRSTDVHSLVHVGQVQGTVDRAVDRPESFALWFWAVDRAAVSYTHLTLPTIYSV